jgi:hypothetical protein
VVERRLSGGEEEGSRELEQFIDEVAWHLPTLALIYVPRYGFVLEKYQQP